MTLAATRAAAFADGVRRRARVLSPARPGGHGLRRPRRARGVTPVERVLRAGPRSVRAGAPRGARIEVRVSLAFRFARVRATERAAAREQAPTPPPQVLRAEPGLRAGGGRVFALPGRPDATGRPPAREERAVASDARVSRPVAPAPLVLRHAGAPGAPLRTEAPAAPAPRSAPPVLALVHRAAPAPAPGTTPTTPPAAGATGGGQALTPLPPLTAADLPRVVERVVGEIDRRVTAARERRGWTA